MAWRAYLGHSYIGSLSPCLMILERKTAGPPTYEDSWSKSIMYSLESGGITPNMDRDLFVVETTSDRCPYIKKTFKC